MGDKVKNSKDFDFSKIIADVDKVKLAKAAKKKKPSTSVKPLKFEAQTEDSPLKTTVIDIINDRDLTYADIYQYCTDLKDGDISEGQKLGYNIISGLRSRHTMLDTTFSMLCDFLNLEVMLVSRSRDTSADKEDNSKKGE
jgi:hypothetical protein